MFGECHAHIFMNGYNYRLAVATHRAAPRESLIREKLKAYQKLGVTFVRDGGDRFGVSLLAKKLAPEYGITYLTPGYAIHKNGCYGHVVGEGFDNLREYEGLVKKLVAQGGDFVKIMTTGILDFDTDGHITGQRLAATEVREMVKIAHDRGLKVMSHTNGAQAVIEAVEAGVDSVEHGNYQTEESLECMAEHPVVWVPTLVTVRNLIGCGRFSDALLEQIARGQRTSLQMAYQKKVSMALGSDAGAYMVPHGIGIVDEQAVFYRILGDGEGVNAHLRRGEGKIHLFTKSS